MSARTTSQTVASAQGQRASLFAAVRAEVIKAKHGAPLRLALALALPFPLLAGTISGRFTGIPDLAFTAWNYYYLLLLPVTLVLVAACVANYDARLRGHAVLSSGVALWRVWLAKALWCLALSLLANLVVFALYAAGAVGRQGMPSLGAMLCAALVCTVATAWMVPATLWLTTRFGMLAGVLVPLVVQLAGEFAWSLALPLYPAFPPTAFLPVLPTGEPIGADAALAASIGHFGVLSALALAVAAATFFVLTAAGAAWFLRSEEL